MLMLHFLSVTYQSNKTKLFNNCMWIVKKQIQASYSDINSITTCNGRIKGLLSAQFALKCIEM